MESATERDEEGDRDRDGDRDGDDDRDVDGERDGDGDRDEDGAGDGDGDRDGDGDGVGDGDGDGDGDRDEDGRCSPSRRRSDIDPVDAVDSRQANQPGRFQGEGDAMCAQAGGATMAARRVYLRLRRGGKGLDFLSFSGQCDGVRSITS
jgi:hypothetical protein